MPDTENLPAADLVKHLPWCCGVYMIRHRKTGERYIGSSNAIRSRVYTHITSWRNGRCGSPGLLRALREHGEDFEYAVVALCAASRLHRREQRAILALKPELNVRDPVTGSPLQFGESLVGPSRICCQSTC